MAFSQPGFNFPSHVSGHASWSTDSLDPWIQSDEGGLWRITAMVTGGALALVSGQIRVYDNTDSYFDTVAFTNDTASGAGDFALVAVADVFLLLGWRVRFWVEGETSISTGHFTATLVGPCNEAGIAGARAV